MRIILDETTLPETPVTLAEGLAAALHRARAMDRVIVDILADGRAIGADELDDQGAMARPCDELRLTTAEPRAFVRVTLQDAADALDGARDEQRRAAELVEAGSTTEAYQALERALGLWQAARQTLDQGSQLLGLDLSVLPFGSTDELPEAIAMLGSGLEEVRRSVTAQDWSGLTDILLYDLDELVGRWQALLRAVAAHIADDAAGS
ncbi:MAG: hypothetical protein IT431_12935 [Phycisphaerales bacterium]|nr:hypothetical protein [Phycisphaerales bacterium]